MRGVILSYPVQVVLFLLLIIRAQADISKYDLIKRLLNSSTYSKDMKPESLTNVNVQVDIYEIAKTETKNTEFSLNLYLRMWWKDDRLEYTNLANYSKLELSEVNTEQIWQPDIYFLSDRKPELHERRTANRIVYIGRNGSIVYSERSSLTLRSSFDLTFYPYDEQRCVLELQSFTYTNDSLILSWHESNPVKVSGAKMTEFLISVGEYIRGDKPPLEQIGIYSTLKASIRLKRTGHAHFYQLYAPSFAVVFVSWLALFLDEKRVSPRLTVHTGCIITLTTQWIGIYFLIPAVSYIRAIDVWMITHLLHVVFAFLANILSLMARRDDSANEVDKWQEIGTTSCEERIFTSLIKISHDFKKKCCSCCCSFFLRFLCSCEAELRTDSKKIYTIPNLQGKLIEIVAIISLFLSYVTFITAFASLVPAQKGPIIYLLVGASVGPVVTFGLVLISFCCVQKVHGCCVQKVHGNDNTETERTVSAEQRSFGTNRIDTERANPESSNKENAVYKRSDVKPNIPFQSANTQEVTTEGGKRGAGQCVSYDDDKQTRAEGTSPTSNTKENFDDIQSVPSDVKHTDPDTTSIERDDKETYDDQRSVELTNSTHLKHEDNEPMDSQL